MSAKARKDAKRRQIEGIQRQIKSTQESIGRIRDTKKSKNASIAKQIERLRNERTMAAKNYGRQLESKKKTIERHRDAIARLRDQIKRIK